MRNFNTLEKLAKSQANTLNAYIESVREDLKKGGLFYTSKLTKKLRNELTKLDKIKSTFTPEEKTVYLTYLRNITKTMKF